jgi:hypothetical protein
MFLVVGVPATVVLFTPLEQCRHPLRLSSLVSLIVNSLLAAAVVHLLRSGAPSAKLWIANAADLPGTAASQAIVCVLSVCGFVAAIAAFGMHNDEDFCVPRASLSAAQIRGPSLYLGTHVALLLNVFWPITLAMAYYACGVAAFLFACLLGQCTYRRSGVYIVLRHCLVNQSPLRWVLEMPSGEQVSWRHILVEDIDDSVVDEMHVWPPCRVVPLTVTVVALACGIGIPSALQLARADDGNCSAISNALTTACLVLLISFLLLAWHSLRADPHPSLPAAVTWTAVWIAMFVAGCAVAHQHQTENRCWHEFGRPDPKISAGMETSADVSLNVAVAVRGVCAVLTLRRRSFWDCGL